MTDNNKTANKITQEELVPAAEDGTFNPAYEGADKDVVTLTVAETMAGTGKYSEEEEVVRERFEGEEPLPEYTLFNVIPKKNLVGLALVILTCASFTIAGLIINIDATLDFVYIEAFVIGVVLLTLIRGTGIWKNYTTAILDTLNGLNWKIILVIRLVLITVCVVIAFILSLDDLRRLYGLLGLVVIIAFCWFFSWNRKAVNWRPVFWGFLLQFLFGVVILRTSAGEATFQFLGDQIQILLEYTREGTSFVFGTLESQQIFAIDVLAVIIFFSAITSVLFHVGLLQKFTLFIGKIMIYTMGTSAPESLSAAGNIFLGQTESPLLVRPYLAYMTNSEIHAVMTGGFATIAGGVLSAFILFGVPANHLLSASVMSAPAALALSKLFYPETLKVDDTKIDKLNIGEKYTNFLEAFSMGASVSIGLLANIIVNLIAFLSFIAFLDQVTLFMFNLIDVELTFTKLVGYFFVPFALLMGIPVDEVVDAGELIGLKVVVNEFVAFLTLLDSNATSIKEGSRSFVILTYALCGFSNFSSIGIQIGALGVMAPTKIKNISRLALSAMLCGNLACFMTACIAGVLVKE